MATVATHSSRMTPNDQYTEAFREEGLSVRVTRATESQAAGKIADAELWFTDGPLEGAMLTGFAVWAPRAAGSRINVTFPARTYSVNGERRSFALLRPQPDANGTEANDRIRDLIVGVYTRGLGQS